jgi:type I restriction enzyme, S subunit
MVANWEDTTVAECAANVPYSTQIGPFGSKIKAEIYKDRGVPVLRGINVNGGRFHDDDFVFVSEEYADAELRKFEARANDVVLVHKGSLGHIGIIPENSRYKRYIMGNSMMKVQCDPERVLPLYLYYWLSSSEGRDYLLSRVSQVGVPQIQRPLSTLREARFHRPPIEEQALIVERLDALDTKIELNHRMNQTVEAMAQAIFKSWFVDFDPVKAKVAAAAAGRSPADIECAAMAAISGKLESELDSLSEPQRQSLAQVAACFPDSLSGSQLGEIPNGWEVSTIGEETETVGGATPSTKAESYWKEGQHHWVTPKDFSSLQERVLLGSRRRITDRGLSKISSGLLPIGTVLMSSRAPVGYLAIAKIETAINQGFIAMKCSGRLPSEYVLHWAGSAMKEIQQAATGSTFAEISKRTFRPFPVLVPQSSVLGAFVTQASPIYEQITANVIESRTLAELRDVVLPRLLSGELGSSGVQYGAKETESE